MADDSAEILFQSFLQEAPCEQFWHGRGCSLFNVVHPAFPLPIKASPTLQSTMKNGFGEAVMACDTPEPSKFLSLDSYREIDLAPHPVVGLVLLEGNVEKFPHALVLKAWILLFFFFFSRVSKQGPYFTAIEEDGGNN